MNILNLRSMISVGLLVSLVAFPALSPHQISASVALPFNFVPTINRSLVGGTQAMRFKRQPLRFEINQGQSDPQIRFLARTGDSTLFLTANEAVLRLPKLSEDVIAGKTAQRKSAFATLAERAPSAVIRLRPAHSNPQPRLVGLETLPGKSNYFIGNDPRKWRTNVEAYARVRYENVYPGVDLIYYGNEAGEIEYDFVVAPGADPDLIAMTVEGADKVELDAESGGLILNTIVGRVQQHAPRIYQEVNGARHEIAGRYRLVEGEDRIGNSQSAIRNSLIAFELGEYDESLPLVIDPVVVYSTLLGGAAGNFDSARDVAVDAAGNAYVVGKTESSDFPTRNALQPTLNGSSDAFVAKFAPDGSLIFSTFLGGGEGDEATAVAVDASGAIYVAGLAGSPDFPTKNAFQASPGGSADAFVTKLAPDGRSIEYSTYLGGNQTEEVADIVLDAAETLYVVGTVFGRGATSVTFPAVNPIQASYGGGDTDAFASFIAPRGEKLMFSTLFDAGVQGGIGGGTDRVSSLMVDSASGDVFVAGNLEVSEDDPELPFVGRFRPVEGRKVQPLDFGGHAVLVVALMYERGELDELEPPTEFAIKITASWMLGLGGGGPGPQLDAKGTAGSAPEVLILAEGLCHPASPGAGCDEPAALAVLDPDLKFKRAANLPLLREFFYAAGTMDAQGAVYIVGDISSNRLTTVDPVQSTFGGRNDVVVAVLKPGSHEPAFVTFLGGDGLETPTSIALDPQGNIFVSGVVTIGTTFPTTPGAFQREIKGRNDAFLVKISAVDIPTGPGFSLSFSQSSVTTSTGKIKVTANINRTGGFAGNVTITPVSLPAGVVMPAGSASTSGNSVKFKLKVKASAARGSHTLTFKARDDSGRERTATMTLIIQ